MKKNHPSVEQWDALLSDASRSAPLQDSSQLIRHLLAGCSSCKEHRPLRPAAGDTSYENAFAAAEHSLSAFFARGHAPLENPETLLGELERLRQEERTRRVASDPRYAHPDVVHLLIDRSHAQRYQDSGEMLHLADLARLAAETCLQEATGSDLRCADLRAESWMQYANALKVCSRFPESDEAFTAARENLDAGTRDPLLRGSLLEQWASLRTSQGRFREAIDLAEEAGEIYEELEETHRLARTMVQRAISCLYAGETEHAIGVLNRAIPLIDPENPQLLLAACHNLVYAYITLDRPEQALSLYFEARPLYKGFEDELILLRVGWQEGQLLRDLGHLRASEAALLQARKGFLERDLAHEVALVSLDLAWVYAKLGQAEELRQTVSEAVPIFRALRVEREVLAALLQLRHAAGREQRAVELIHLLNSHLARHQASK